MLSRRWFILWGLLVLVSALAACGPVTPMPGQNEAVPPVAFALESVTPPPSAALPLRPVLKFTFTRPLDAASARAAFHMRRADDDAEVAGKIAFPDADTLEFTPANPLRPDTAYNVTIDAALTSADGEHLSEAVRFSYTTEAALAVLAVTPKHKSAGVAPDTAITVVFNKPMVPLTGREDEAAAPLPLEISPQVEGTGRWVSTAIYLFQPKAPLKGNTTYTVTVPAGVATLNGETLDEDYTWSFTTRAARVQSLYFDGQYLEPNESRVVNFVRLDAAIQINFNTSMDPASTEAALRIASVSGAPVPRLRFTWKYDNTTLIIAPKDDDRYAYDTAYTLLLTTDARSADGGNLGEAVVANFRTVGLPAVLFTRPASGTTQQHYSPWVTVGFNTYLDKDSLEGHIRVTPAPQKLLWSIYDRQVSIGALDANTTYTITLLPGIADIYGNTLTEPYTFTVTTAPLSPSGDVLLPSHVTLVNAQRDTPLWVRYDNLDAISLTLYSVDDDVMMKSVAEYRNCPARGKPVATWSPSRWYPNDASRTHYLRVSLKELANGEDLAPGPYCLSARFSPNPMGRSQDTHWLLLVTDNITLESSTSNALTWVTDLETGTPQANLPVQTYAYDDVTSVLTPLAARATNADGVAFWENTAHPARFALLHTDDRFAFTDADWSASPTFSTSWSLAYSSRFDQPQVAYVYTDRPLYRPGQEIFFKGVLRYNDDLHYTLPSVSEVWVSLWHEGKSIAQQKVPVSALGTFSGSVMLAPEAPVGTYFWEVRLSPDDEDIGSGSLRVATYHKPVFLVELTPEQKALHVGEATNVQLEATYYAGDRVAHGAVTWDITTDKTAFHPPAKYSDYTFYRQSTYYWYEEEPVEKTAAEPGPQHGVTDAQGHLTIPLKAPDDTVGDDVRMTVWADVTDAAGNTASGHTDVVVRVSDVYVGIKANTHLATAGKPVTFALIVLDPQGHPVPNTAITITVTEKQWHSVQRRDASGMLRWESHLETVPVGTFTDIRTDANGKATFTFTPEKSGIYSISAKALDAAGRPRTASVSLWAAGEDAVLWNRSDDELPLFTDHEAYHPGDTAQLTMPQPFAEPSYALLTLARTRIHDYRVFRIDQPITAVDIPLSSEMAPGMTATVITVQGASDEKPPAYAVGTTHLHVALDEQQVDVTIKPDREKLAPGETVHIAIETRTRDGKPISADVSLALVDQAIYALAPDNTDLLSFFYPDNPALFRLACATGLDHDLQAHNLYLERMLPEGEGMGSGGGGKGADTEGVITLRENFRDTAYWRANILTDAQGHAEVAVTVPDNMTTWVLTAHAVTADSRFGKARAEITVSRPFFVRLHTPAFFTGGDRVVIQAVVHNTTDRALDAVVSLSQHRGLTLESPTEQDVHVPAHGQAVARWEVRVPYDATRVDLKVTAEANGYRDASRPLLTTLPDGGIPVYQFTTHEQVGTAGLLFQEGGLTEYVLPPDNVLHAALQLDISGSLLGSLPAYLEHAPQPEGKFPSAWAANLKTNVAVWQAYNVLDVPLPQSDRNLPDIIRKGIQALEATAGYDGGWGWSPQTDSSPWITAYALDALLDARDAGFPVDAATLDKAAAFLDDQIDTKKIRTASSWELEQLAFEIAVAARVEPKPAAAYALAKRLEHNEMTDTAVWAYLLLAGQRMGMGEAFMTSAEKYLLNNMVRSAAGVHWESRGCASNVKTTALALEALLNTNARPEDLGLAVHWLMMQRKAGRWNSLYDDAAVLHALTRWAAVYDVQPDYDYRVSLGDDVAQEGHMDAASAQTPVSLRWEDTLPLGQRTPLVVQRGPGRGVLYYDAYLELTLPAQDVEARNDGIAVTRRYYHLDDLETPDTTFHTGETVQVRLEVIVPHDLDYVVLTDYLPAGMEALEFASAHTLHSANDFRRWGWGGWYFGHREIYDERVVFGAIYLPAGVYTVVYYARAAVPGTFQTRPVEAHETFFPDVAGRSAGEVIVIK